jgi:hypothetical protein
MVEGSGIQRIGTREVKLLGAIRPPSSVVQRRHGLRSLYAGILAIRNEVRAYRRQAEAAGQYWYVRREVGLGVKNIRHGFRVGIIHAQVFHPKEILDRPQHADRVVERVHHRVPLGVR